MNHKEYERIIEATGGITKSPRGDRPQPLTQADEAAFDRAWAKAAAKVKNPAAGVPKSKSGSSTRG